VERGTGLYGACRSTQCCLAVWSRWVESITRLGGFRALKKTTEAPYTTKVNYCKCTSRGTTLLRKPLAGVDQRSRYAKRTQFSLPSRVRGSVTTHSSASRSRCRLLFLVGVKHVPDTYHSGTVGKGWGGSEPSSFFTMACTTCDLFLLSGLDIRSCTCARKGSHSARCVR
jgi:hypothetical protein